MHPLRIVYRNYIEKHYGFSTGAGNDSQAEQAAGRIRRTGLSFENYVNIACKLLYEWANDKDWRYPYWHMVVAENTVSRILELLELDDCVEITDARLFQLELMYAADYIYWYCNGGDMPRRVTEVSVSVIIDVAEHICNQYGVECISSNYNIIAASIERSGKLG